jgi:hypothetical protein
VIITIELDAGALRLNEAVFYQEILAPAFREARQRLDQCPNEPVSITLNLNSHYPWKEAHA